MEFTGGVKVGLIDWIGSKICNVLCVFPEFLEYTSKIGLYVAPRCVKALVDRTNIPIHCQGFPRVNVWVAIE